jgi:hypothetical protein
VLWCPLQFQGVETSPLTGRASENGPVVDMAQFAGQRLEQTAALAGQSQHYVDNDLPPLGTGRQGAMDCGMTVSHVSIDGYQLGQSGAFPGRVGPGDVLCQVAVICPELSPAGALATGRSDIANTRPGNGMVLKGQQVDDWGRAVRVMAGVAGLSFLHTMELACWEHMVPGEPFERTHNVENAVWDELSGLFHAPPLARAIQVKVYTREVSGQRTRARTLARASADNRHLYLSSHAVRSHAPLSRVHQELLTIQRRRQVLNEREQARAAAAGALALCTWRDLLVRLRRASRMPPRPTRRARRKKQRCASGRRRRWAGTGRGRRSARRSRQRMRCLRASASGPRRACALSAASRALRRGCGVCCVVTWLL